MLAACITLLAFTSPISTQESTEDLARTVARGDHEEARSALLKLSSRGPAGVDALVDALDLRDDERRFWVVKTIARMETAAAPAAPRLAALLGDHQPLEAATLRHALALTVLRQAASMLISDTEASLTAKERAAMIEDVREDVLHLALAKAGAAALDPLAAIVRERGGKEARVGSEYSTLRVLFARAADTAGAKASEAVRTALRASDESSQAAGLLAAGLVVEEVPDLSDDIAPFLSAPSAHLRWRAVEALSFAPADCGRWRTPLLACLQDENGLVRVHAASALRRQCEDPATVAPTLLEALKSGTPRTRLVAVLELEQHESVSAELEERLYGCLKDKDAFLRLRAIGCLARLRSDPKELAKRLKPLTRDKDPGVAAAAEQALSKL